MQVALLESQLQNALPESRDGQQANGKAAALLSNAGGDAHVHGDAEHLSDQVGQCMHCVC